MRQKAEFYSRPRKNKAGEVIVIRHKSGFRTLNVCGRVSVPSFFSNYPYVLQRIINQVGAYFLGLFPFLSKREDKRICTYSLPETMAKKKDQLDLTYDFLYTVAAVDIPYETILRTVLSRNSEIGELILDKLDKEMEDAYLDGG